MSVLTELTSQRRKNGSDAARVGHHFLGDIEIDEHMRMVRLGGREVRLTPKEYELLVALARRNGAPASKQALMKEVWNTRATDSRTLDQHVFELRRKLERSRQPRHIITVRKFGYRLISDDT